MERKGEEEEEDSRTGERENELFHLHTIFNHLQDDR